MRLVTSPCAICHVPGKGARWHFAVNDPEGQQPLDSFSVHKRCYRDAGNLVVVLNHYLQEHPGMSLGEVRSED